MFCCLLRDCQTGSSLNARIQHHWSSCSVYCSFHEEASAPSYKLICWLHATVMIKQPVDGSVPISHCVWKVVHITEASVYTREVDVALQKSWILDASFVLPERSAHTKKKYSLNRALRLLARNSSGSCKIHLVIHYTSRWSSLVGQGHTSDISV